MHAVFITACYVPVMAEVRFIVYKRIRGRGAVCAALPTWAATLEPLLLPGWGGCTCNRMKCAGCDSLLVEELAWGAVSLHVFISALLHAGQRCARMQQHMCAAVCVDCCMFHVGVVLGVVACGGACRVGAA
jgi:hypothetical protein